MTEIIQHLSWNDRNVSQFFINELVDFVRNKQNTLEKSNSVSNVVMFPPALDTAFKILRGILSMQDGELHNERFVFLLDLNKVFIDAKPLFQVLHKDAQRNPKFVLYSLAFIAEIAFQDDKLLEYLRTYQNSYSGWMIQFLEFHC